MGWVELSVAKPNIYSGKHRTSQACPELVEGFNQTYAGNSTVEVTGASLSRSIWLTAGMGLMSIEQANLDACSLVPALPAFRVRQPLHYERIFY